MIIKTWYPERNTGSDFTHPKYYVTKENDYITNGIDYMNKMDAVAG